jgi:hypothetical protein
MRWLDSATNTSALSSAAFASLVEVFTCLISASISRFVAAAIFTLR